jgi:nucleoside-diphosphate kinase
MATTRTFSIIKPDATRRNITGAITQMLEEAGLRVVASKRIRMTRTQAEGFYAVHKERPFFNDLVAFMVSGPVVVQVLEGEDAVTRNRDVMGATNPAAAAEGTIRKAYAESIEANSVHGSDSPENARIEIDFFFTPEEIVGCRSRMPVSALLKQAPRQQNRTPRVRFIRTETPVIPAKAGIPLLFSRLCGRQRDSSFRWYDD